MNDEAIRHFKETGAILEGHFQLSSGLHSDRYLQCALVLQHPRRAEELCRTIRRNFLGEQPELIVGPAMGGITIAYELGRAFDCPAIFTERENGRFVLRRGFGVKQGQRVMIAEDVITTGGSAAEVVRLVREAGGRVVGVASLVHRTEKNPFDVPLVSVMQLIVPAWPKDACPLCAQGIPAIKPGSRPTTGR